MTKLWPALLVFLAFSSPAQHIDYRYLPEGLLEQRLRLAHPKIAERYSRLRQLFIDTGCADLTTQAVKGSKEPNPICAVNGTGDSPNRIVVGAHFDSVGGDGVIDNWSGAILLPSLAEMIRAAPRRHRFEFVGFAGEERGLLGSKTYVKALGREGKQQIGAVVTMDSLGLTSTKVWPNSSSKELVALASNVAFSMKLPFSGVNVDGVGTTDSMTFHEASIPVLSLHSVTSETWSLINSNKDVWKSVSWKDYYETHRFISALLAYLDQKLP